MKFRQKYWFLDVFWYHGRLVGPGLTGRKYRARARNPKFISWSILTSVVDTDRIVCAALRSDNETNILCIMLFVIEVELEMQSEINHVLNFGIFSILRFAENGDVGFQPGSSRLVGGG